MIKYFSAGTAIGALLVSVGINIWQAIQNRKLRKQIEMLDVIIRNLNSDIDQLKTELKSLKFWCFGQKHKLNKQISEKKMEMEEKLQERSVLEGQLE